MRSFISYSRSDRQRILGLASLLDALGHAVFVDQRSIKAGQQWREELFVELESAEVLIVFWTRSASSSSWVRREFEYFNRRFPERPLIPITWDQTKLPSDLENRQSVSFFPLINELFEISHNLHAQRVSRRKIRAVLLERLREEGVDLTDRSRRNRILALFGVAVSPLVFTLFISDAVVDRISRLPVSHILTGGSAVVFGVVVCQNLDSPADLLLTPDLHQVPIRAGQSGTDACEADGLICVSVARAPIHDRDRRFFGYSTPTCSSRVVRATGAATMCWDDSRTRYAYEDVVLQKSPDADDDVPDFSGYNYFCLASDKGRLGIYEFANCVKP